MHVVIKYPVVSLGKKFFQFCGFHVNSFLCDDFSLFLTPPPGTSIDNDGSDDEMVYLHLCKDTKTWDLQLESGDEIECEPVFIPKFLQQYIERNLS
jgi:hypothetical protein